MSFLSVLKVEFIKLSQKKSSLLLLLFYVPTLLFGVGMWMGLSFFVSDGGNEGVSAVGASLSGMGFAINMLEQSKYIIFLVAMVLAASSLSGELEGGQIKSEIIRICGRSKILLAKYVVLVVVLGGAVLVSLFWSFCIYAVCVQNTEYASGLLYDELLQAQLGYFFFLLIGLAAAVAVTFLLGIRLKMFSCFAVSYILWFTSLYSDFMGKIKLLIPYNMPNYLLENTDIRFHCQPYAALYIGYCGVFLLCACLIFQKGEIKG